MYWNDSVHSNETIRSLSPMAMIFAYSARWVAMNGLSYHPTLADPAKSCTDTGAGIRSIISVEDTEHFSRLWNTSSNMTSGTMGIWGAINHTILKKSVRDTPTLFPTDFIDMRPCMDFCISPVLQHLVVFPNFFCHQLSSFIEEVVIVLLLHIKDLFWHTISLHVH